MVIISIPQMPQVHITSGLMKQFAPATWLLIRNQQPSSTFKNSFLSCLRHKAKPVSLSDHRIPWEADSEGGRSLEELCCSGLRLPGRSKTQKISGDIWVFGEELWHNVLQDDSKSLRIALMLTLLKRQEDMECPQRSQGNTSTMI